MRETQEAGPDFGPFEFQKWPVYRRALGFHEAAGRLCRQMKGPEMAEIRDQLRRASQSVILNIAEGCSRTGTRDKANFWRIAKGSVFECAAILDVVSQSKEVSFERRAHLAMLEEIGKMLSGLLRWLEANGRKR